VRCSGLFLSQGNETLVAAAWAAASPISRITSAAILSRIPRSHFSTIFPQLHADHGRHQREAHLTALDAAGIPSASIWLGYLRTEDIALAGDTALAIVTERHGGDAATVVETRHAEISAAIDGAANYHDATRVALREGPCVALLLMPDAAYGRALEPHAAQLADAASDRPRRCLLRHRSA
jgi:hypothetical protein